MLPTAEQLNDPEFSVEQFIIEEVERRIKQHQKDEFLESLKRLLEKAKTQDRFGRELL